MKRVSCSNSLGWFFLRWCWKRAIFLVTDKLHHLLAFSSPAIINRFELHWYIKKRKEKYPIWWPKLPTLSRCTNYALFFTQNYHFPAFIFVSNYKWIICTEHTNAKLKDINFRNRMILSRTLPYCRVIILLKSYLHRIGWGYAHS